MRNMPYQCEVKSIWDAKARRKAAVLVKKGFPIGVYNRGVCAIWGDGRNKEFIKKVAEIKGEERNSRPLAATLSTQEIVSLMDTSKIPETLLPIFSKAEELTARLGSLCFIRFPIKESAIKGLPSSIISYSADGTAILQNWDPDGHNVVHLLVQEMRKHLVLFPAVTSMNISGQPEIIDQDDGIKFSREHKIPLFLYDLRDKGAVKGSYTIFSLDSKGVKLVRDGNIPAHLFAHLLEMDFDRSEAKAAKHPQLDFPASLTQGLNPSEARIAILSYVHGYPKEHTRRTILKITDKKHRRS